MENQQYPQNPPPPPGMPPKNPGQGMSIAGMVLGIVGLVFSWVFYIGIPCAVVGLVLSVLGMKKSKEAGFPSGMAMAGIVCSAVALGLNAACIICVCAAIGQFANSATGSFPWGEIPWSDFT